MSDSETTPKAGFDTGNGAVMEGDRVTVQGRHGIAKTIFHDGDCHVEFDDRPGYTQSFKWKQVLPCPMS